MKKWLKKRAKARKISIAEEVRGIILAAMVLYENPAGKEEVK